MGANPRIEDLRRRVERDPASIAFAQLAEEYRRAGLFNDAVDTCRAGLAVHPGYLSARVTLGRSLIELGQLEEAREDLERVLVNAPENLAAIRGVAEIHFRLGDLAGALAQYKAALALARNDPELEETVRDLERQLAPRRGPDPEDGLSLEQMSDVFAIHGNQQSPVASQQSAVDSHQSPVASQQSPVESHQSEGVAEASEAGVNANDDTALTPEYHAEMHLAPEHLAEHLAPEHLAPEHPAPVHLASEHLAPVHPAALARLEAFLDAIHAARTERRA